MLLAIDLGNTNIHVGLFRDGTSLPQSEFGLGTDERRSADEYALTLSALIERCGCDIAQIDGVIVASVVPTMTGKVLSAVKKLTTAPVTTVGPGVKTGFSIRLSDPSELGADLAANAVGAIASVGAPCVIVDLGTATVVSAVTREDGSAPAFVGASILPGVRMSFDALGDTGLLPDVPAGTSQAPRAGLPVVGKNTPDAMRSGVIRGQALAVDGLVSLYKRTLSLGETAPVVVTGGCTEELLPLLPKEYVHLPFLTLTGLMEMWRLNEKKK